MKKKKKKINKRRKHWYITLKFCCELKDNVNISLIAVNLLHGKYKIV